MPQGYPKIPGPCSVVGCEREQIIRGWCGKHYQRWRSYGDPLYGSPLDWLKNQLVTGDPDYCWPWPFSKDDFGYGNIGFHGVHRRAHSVALELSGKARPKAPNNQALHTCDSPCCVNPSHVRWGSAADNVADRMRRNPRSWLKGEDHPNAKLTVEAVRTIRADRQSLDAMSRRFGVSVSAIDAVRSGRTWAWLK